MLDSGTNKLESFEELRVFSQIIESGTMAAAGRALGLPPSTVSRRLAQLEERLGVKLVNRTTRSLNLSEHGRLLLSRVRRILDEAAAAEALVDQAAAEVSGVVRIGVPSVLTRDLLFGLAPTFIEHSGLRLQISVFDRPVNPVAEGLDLQVIGGGLSDSGLISRKIGDVRLILAASRDYIQRRGAPTRPADLAGHDTLHFLRDPPVSRWELFDEHGQGHEVPVDVRVEASDGRALVDALRAGLGVGTLSERLVRAHPELERVLPNYAFRPFPVHAVYPTSGKRSARLQVIVRALEEAIGTP